MNLYSKTSIDVSEAIIRNYSTSFYWSSLFFKKDVREAIFAIYGFVRIADEIVDSFQEYDQQSLFDKFENDLEDAFRLGVSMNPVLNAFVAVVNQYRIDMNHVNAFMNSMRADLNKRDYVTDEEMDSYVYGSAEVVGLMCLKVFCNGDNATYNSLEHSAIKLGSAFQKVNFLRDIKTDMQELNRSYFPSITELTLTDTAKASIISSIEAEFNEAIKGIKALPKDARLAVLIAYYYYVTLLDIIKQLSANEIASRRVRVSNTHKFFLIIKAYFNNSFIVWSHR